MADLDYHCLLCVHVRLDRLPPPLRSCSDPESTPQAKSPSPVEENLKRPFRISTMVPAPTSRALQKQKNVPGGRAEEREKACVLNNVSPLLVSPCLLPKDEVPLIIYSFSILPPLKVSTPWMPRAAVECAWSPGEAEARPIIVEGRSNEPQEDSKNRVPSDPGPKNWASDRLAQLLGSPKRGNGFPCSLAGDAAPRLPSPSERPLRTEGKRLYGLGPYIGGKARGLSNVQLHLPVLCGTRVTVAGSPQQIL